MGPGLEAPSRFREGFHDERQGEVLQRHEGVWLHHPEDQQSADVFVHFSAIESDGFRTLHEGDVVQFEMIRSTRGTEATQVMKL
jgi:CspA family cold shock protein